MSDNLSSSQLHPSFTSYTPYTLPTSPSTSGIYPPHTPLASQTASQYAAPAAPINQYRSTESPLPFTGSPTSFETAPIIRPLFIDNLAKEHNLTEKQRKNLHVMAKFASVDEGIAKPELLVKLYEMTLHFELYNNPKTIEDQNNTDTMRRMLRDLQIRMEQTFALTPNQNKTIRALAQDLIYDPLRTCYQDLSADVFDDIKKNAKQYGFDNVFGVPAYEKVLEKATVKHGSSVRNGFRQHLRDGMGKGLSVVEFTGRMNKIYLRAGGPAHNRELILNRNIILRNFIHQNPNAVWVDEEGEPDIEEEFDQPATGTKKRKLKPATAGRVPKGQDFWSILDKWFAGKLEVLGKKMTDVKWKEFIDECRRLDEVGFNHTALEDVATTSAAQAPVSSIGTPVHGTSSATGPDERMQLQNLLACVAVYYFSPLWPYNVSTVLSLDGGSNITVSLMDTTATPADGGAATVPSAARHAFTGLSNGSHMLSMFSINISDPSQIEWIVVDGFNVTVEDNSPQPSTVPSSKSNVGVIAGGAAGGVFLAAILAFFFIYLCRKRRQRQLVQPWEGKGILAENPPTPIVPLDAFQPYSDFSPYPPLPVLSLGGSPFPAAPTQQGFSHQSVYPQPESGYDGMPSSPWAGSTDAGAGASSSQGGSGSTLAKMQPAYFNEKRLQQLIVTNEEPRVRVDPPPVYAMEN
ncbi:hypothetical protein BT96DRAFT_1007020 [Gymnopus androsaceus JB14]|uniref:Uncharacterized protein n=1 Tax=Gymnopus androsaceus JB14 TaxID=1447944 RepID=A0A6A4GIH8_9AGAR|nr:hypothetical protein BT96DRAFT_1007020 [Gymnopus androsaceus JB14]